MDNPQQRAALAAAINDAKVETILQSAARERISDRLVADKYSDQLTSKPSNRPRRKKSGRVANPAGVCSACFDSILAHTQSEEPQSKSPMCLSCAQRWRDIVNRDKQEGQRFEQWKRAQEEYTWKCTACSDSWKGKARDLLCVACGERGPPAFVLLRAIESARKTVKDLGGEKENEPARDKRRGRLKRAIKAQTQPE